MSALFKSSLAAGMLALLGLARTAQAGDPQQELLRKLTAFNGSALSYSYRVRLLDDRNKAIDSLRGRLTRSGRDYADSSTAGCTILRGQYLFKLDHARKEASLYNLKTLQQKTGLELEQQSAGLWTVPDSVIARYGTLKVDTASKAVYVLSWDLSRGAVKRFQVTLNRHDYQPLAVSLVFEEEDPGEPGRRYRRILDIDAIRATADPRSFETGSLYRIVGAEAVLNRRYAHYHLQSLL